MRTGEPTRMRIGSPPRNESGYKNLYPAGDSTLVFLQVNPRQFHKKNPHDPISSRRLDLSQKRAESLGRPGKEQMQVVKISMRAWWKIMKQGDSTAKATAKVTSSTRARRGGSCLRFDYKTFFIYRTCMRRAPARPVRVCIVQTCCAAVQEQDLRATTLQCNAKRTLSSHFTRHYSHPALHTSQLHFTVHTSSHLKSFELFSPHVTSSQLFSSHPIPSYMASKEVLLNCLHLIRALKKVHLNSSQLFCTHESSYCWSAIFCTKRHRAYKALAHRSLRHRCIYKEKSWQHTLYYKACTKHVPVLLCTTKFAQSTSQYYFVLHSMHNALPSTTLYYKACTKYLAVLCIAKLTQNTFHLVTYHYRSLDAATPLRFPYPAAKDNSITHAAMAPSNLDAAITMRSTEAELQKHNSTTRKKLRNCSSGWILTPEPKTDFWSTF